MKSPVPYASPDEAGVRESLALARTPASDCLDSARVSGPRKRGPDAPIRQQARPVASANGGNSATEKSYFTFPARYTQDKQASPPRRRGARYRRDPPQRQRPIPLLRKRCLRTSGPRQGERFSPLHRSCAFPTDARTAIASSDTPVLTCNRGHPRGVPTVCFTDQAGGGIHVEKGSANGHPPTLYGNSESNDLRFAEGVVAVVTGTIDHPLCGNNCQAIAATAHAHPL